MRLRALSSLKGSLVGFFRGDPNLNNYKARGLKVGSNFNMLGGCIIDHSHCWLIRIGDNVTFAPRVHVLAHDASTKRVLGYTRIALTSIGNDVFVGASSTIMPGVTVGGGAVSLTMNGENQITSLKISKDAIDPEDPEMLEDLITTAVNEASRKSAEMAQKRMQEVPRGLGLPGGMF